MRLRKAIALGSRVRSVCRLKRFSAFLFLTLWLPFGIALAQVDSTGSQPDTSLGQSSQDACQDPTSATCVPQSTDNSMGNYNYGAGATGGAAAGSGLPNSAGTNGQAYGTGYQSMTSPNYRDENALPNQNQNRNRNQYGYTPYEQPEPLTEFQKFVAETTGQVLPIFGEKLFRRVPTTFSPVDQIPVPADALVGPGDLLRIRIWGQVNFSADLRVDRSGEIYLPQVGPVHVAGLQYSDLDAHLRTAIGRVYRNFQVSAELGQIRSIEVYVMGRARRPGTYTVSSLSTLIDAVFASGGPALDGSLRHILLKRGGRTVTDLDLYQLLVHGDRTGDAKLESGDVIYIPTAGPQVAVLGSVKAPAIYEELAPPATVEQMIDAAAGVTSVAGANGWTIERIVNRDGRSVERLAATASGLDTPVGDGDILRVDSMVPSYRNTVTLRGNTANPGRYAWKPGMRLADLVPDRMALLTRNYWWQRTREGLAGPEFERVPSLARLVQPNQPETLPISPEDQERIREQREQYLLEQRRREALRSQQGQTQQQGGNGQQGVGANPSDAGLGLGADLGAGLGEDLGAVGGDAYGLGGVDLNDQGSGQTQEYIPNQQGGQQGYGDEGAAPSASAAGRNVQTENTANAQEVTRVSLPAPEIDWDYAVIERLNPETLKTSLIPFDLGRLVMDHDPSQNLLLQPGDTVIVFSQADIHIPVEQQTRLVKLEGEFVHSGVYSVKPGETLQELVQRAGGFAPGAYLYGSEFTRASVRAVQQKRLDDYIQQLQLQIERGVLATSSSAASSQADLASATASESEARELVNRLRQIRATGRIVLRLQAASEQVQDLPSLRLEDGDAFYVPPVPSSISVIGAVYDQTSFVFGKGHTVREYVRLAGGANRNADKKHPFVIRADGSVISRDQVGKSRFEALEIEAGDTIVVSEKTFGPSKLRAFLDFSQLFSQLAIGAAVATNL